MLRAHDATVRELDLPLVFVSVFVSHRVRGHGSGLRRARRGDSLDAERNSPAQVVLVDELPTYASTALASGKSFTPGCHSVPLRRKSSLCCCRRTFLYVWFHTPADALGALERVRVGAVILTHLDRGEPGDTAADHHHLVPGGVRVGVAGAGGGGTCRCGRSEKSTRTSVRSGDTIGSRRSGRPRWSARADGCRAVRAGC